MQGFNADRLAIPEVEAIKLQLSAIASCRDLLYPLLMYFPYNISAVTTNQQAMLAVELAREPYG